VPSSRSLRCRWPRRQRRHQRQRHQAGPGTLVTLRERGPARLTSPGSPSLVCVGRRTFRRYVSSATFGPAIRGLHFLGRIEEVWRATGSGADSAAAAFAGPPLTSGMCPGLPRSRAPGLRAERRPARREAARAEEREKMGAAPVTCAGEHVATGRLTRWSSRRAADPGGTTVAQPTRPGHVGLKPRHPLRGVFARHGVDSGRARRRVAEEALCE
jgi:hypothetical protein